MVITMHSVVTTSEITGGPGRRRVPVAFGVNVGLRQLLELRFTRKITPYRRVLKQSVN